MFKTKFKKSFFDISVLPKLMQFIHNLDTEKEYVISVEKVKKKRSLNANAYFWVLCDKLAEATNISKAEIYRSYIKNIGGNNETVCIVEAAVDKLKSGWEHNGLGWTVDVIDSKIEGCKNVILYYGSSTYDTKQMTRLIDFAVQDCKALSIETMTPQELSLLVEEWGNEQKK